MEVEVANGGKSMACYEGGMSTIIQQMMQYQSVVEYVGASLVNTCARTNSHKYEREREREPCCKLWKHPIGSAGIRGNCTQDTNWKAYYVGNTMGTTLNLNINTTCQCA